MTEFDEMCGRIRALAAMDPIPLPPPGGVAELRDLASQLTLRREHPERMKTPARTLCDGGGDWDDIICLLMAAAHQAGISTRILKLDGAMRLQARPSDSCDWESVGPAGYVRVAR